MNHERIKDYFFGLVMILSVIATIIVFRPYLLALALGGVLALVAMPLYRPLRRFIRSDMAAAFLTVVLILTVIVIPCIYFFAALAQEIGSLFSNVSAIFDYGRISQLLHNRLPPAIQAQIPAIMEQAAGVVGSVVKGLSTNLLKLFSNLVGFTLDFLVMIFATYYLLKDGQKIKRELLRLSPMSDDKDERVFKNVVVTVQAVVVGLLLVGLIKGILSGIGYWIAGLPAPFFWGSMTGLAFFVPVIGSGLVMIPAIIYLAVIGHWGSAIILGIFFVAIVGTIDNLVQPLFIGDRAKIHPLLILLAILGGLEFFGFTGIIVGPLVLAVTLALVQIYETDYAATRDKLKAEGGIKNRTESD